MVIAKIALARIHDEVDALSPLLGDLALGQGSCGSLRDQVSRVVQATDSLKREIEDLLPDPRSATNTRQS
ncbi:hypothetical protein [Nocardioides sp. LHG3406-4]|uniref:hypothetical protein n=1 Tax=Nocardioides sp. LHG3406-4 TaxID=2804575 RepID=UPI003CF8EB1C